MAILDTLPYEVLAHIFEYVLEREDIKSCRLVCHQWYTHFDSRSVRDRENFVFRSGMCSVEEMNEILLNYAGSAIHLNLISYSLERVLFQDFGEKIRGLQLTHCQVNNEQALENLFVSTPNMTCFHFDEFCLDWGFRESSKFPDVIVHLRRLGFTNNNLRKFDTNDSFVPIPQMYEIFPRLESLRLESTYLSTIVKYNYAFNNKGLKELARIRVSVGKESTIAERNYPVPREKKDTAAERNFLLSLPKLKELEIDFWFTREEKKDSFNMCLDFFTQQTELESLVVSFRCQDEKYLTWTYQNTDKQHASVNCRAKNLIFHVLKSCRNLRSFSFILHCEDLQFSDADMQEFVHAIRSTKIRELEFPVTALYCDAFTSHLASLQTLECFKLHEFHHTNNNQGRKPVLSLTKVYQALSAVLRSNKNLKRLQTPEMYLYHEANVSINEELETNRIYHDRLEHMEFAFQDPITKPSLVEYLMSWELPRLSTLKLKPVGSCWHEPYVADSETKTRLMKWIEKMPLLKYIDLRFIWLTIDDILEICKRLPKLQVIWFEDTKSADKKKLRELFTKFPTVQKLNSVLCQEINPLDNSCGTFHSNFYFVNRHKRIVYLYTKGITDFGEPFMWL